MSTFIALSALLLACSSSTGDPPTPAAPAPAEPTVDPAALYAECGAAVEGPGEAGECSTDADCATMGCSGEVCVSKATAASGMSTACIERPCHAVLDACGCVDGQCTWSLKDPA